MMRTAVRFSLIALFAAGCSSADSPVAVRDGDLGPAGAGDVGVVVVLKPAFAPGGPAANQARAAEIARELGIAARHAYGTAVFGFAGTVPEGRLTALARDPRVESVDVDREWGLAAQTIPTGIDRIEADRNPHADIDGDNSVVNLDVAIIDTGIDGAHADLNVAGGMNFTNGPSNKWSDSNGHGTHVAGTVGARDNGIGVVGVAPGVRLWAVKVCGGGGFCWTSDMVAGIDWVASQKASGAINFAAANMSISTANDATACHNGSDSVHKAICGLVNRGVVFALAAGNEGALKQAYPEAITVSAVADFDGKPGGVGASTCRTDVDDRLASFSNYGSTVDIAAPGVCILSTWSGGGYSTISGTSMATPHVTGAVALYLHANGQAPATNAAGVASITSAIIGAGKAEGSACGYTNHRGYSEPLLFVNGAAFGGDGTCDSASGGGPTDDPPTVSITSPSGGTTVSGTITIEASAGDDNGVAQVEFFVDGASIGVDADPAGGWSISWNTTTAADGAHNLTAIATDTATQQTTSAPVSVTVSNPGGGGGGGGTMHVGDLDGAGSLKGKSGKWEAQVTVRIHDESHAAVTGATVTGNWSTGGSSSGVTGTDGSVLLVSGNITAASATFTVTSVSHGSLSYEVADNHEPDGDSDGTSITITRP